MFKIMHCMPSWLWMYFHNESGLQYWLLFLHNRARIKMPRVPSRILLSKDFYWASRMLKRLIQFGWFSSMYYMPCRILLPFNINFTYSMYLRLLFILRSNWVHRLSCWLLMPSIILTPCTVRLWNLLISNVKFMHLMQCGQWLSWSQR